jgi:hypothetical protein
MKRSTGVVLVLMGATAVGGTAWWVSSRDCRNVTPGTPQAEQCRTSGSSYGSRYYWGGHGSSQSSSYTQNSAGKTGPATSPGVARSGFGTTSHGYSSGS